MTANNYDFIGACRRSLLSYCSLTNPIYQIPSHIERIAGILENVEAGKLKRVIITIPPRHGKSLLCSNYFPAWYMGRNPEKYLITATYGQDLSDDFGRKVRDQLQSPEFKGIFPQCLLDSRTQASSRMQTTLGGSYFGVGAGGPITGRGAHLLLIDDPIKNREEADSQVMREKLYDWYRSVAYTRLMPNGAIVVIMTRWHEDDLVGRLLKDHSHENWEVVHLPAIANDKPLWPQAYSLSALENIRKTIGEYDWQCLYQQDPIPPDGIIVKPDWMKPGRRSDGYSAIMIGVDPAVGLKQTNDETSITVTGYGYGFKPEIDELETIYGHYTMDEIGDLIEALYKKYKADMIGVEDVQAQAWLVQSLAKRGLRVAPIKTGGKDKVARFMGVSHFFTQGRVSVTTAKLREQGLRFRGGSEANDLWDSFVYSLILIRDYTSERSKTEESPQDRFKGMSSHDLWRIQTKEYRKQQLANETEGNIETFNPTHFEVGSDFY